MSKTASEIKSAEPVSPFRNDILKDRVVLITGGATGIGFGMCQCFGKHGAKVGTSPELSTLVVNSSNPRKTADLCTEIAITARREKVIAESVEKLRAEGVEAFGVPGDVRDPEKCKASVEAVVARFGRLDYVVNNAAGNFMVSTEELTPNGLATVLGIDLQGCFNMAKAALPHLKRAGAEHGLACIINITATLQYKATPFQFHASAAKAGIDVLTNNIGVEWAEYGIRCVGIAPGPISGTVGGPGGRVFGGAGQAGVEAQEPSARFVRRSTPAGRYGRVDDIGLAAVYLCSSAGGFITATTLVVDGGQWHGTSGSYLAAREMIAEKSKTERENFKGGVKKSKL